MIDSHCHLTDPRLFNQLDAVLARAAAAGVTSMVSIGTGHQDSKRSVDLCRGRANLRCTVGIHPNHCDEEDLDCVNALRDETVEKSVVAIGETGLDYFHKFAPRDRQRKFFIAQLALAAERGLPVVIHARDAIDDTLAIMADAVPVSAVFHCFTGTMAEAERILAARYYMGFTGPVTYKKNDGLRAITRLVPIDRLVIETDAPYLSPEPLRGQKTNEPSFVPYVLATIATARGLPVHELDAITTANTRRFYNWLD